MPRKVNGMPFELHPSPMKNEKGEKLLYARPMQGRSITLDDLDYHCCVNSGLSRNMLVSVFRYFTTACAEFLADGKRIETPMGTFSPRLGLKRELTDPAEVRVDDVEWRGIEFQPSKQFMEDIMRQNDGFIHAPNCQRKKHEPTEAQLLQALGRSIADCKGHTTVRSFSFFSGLTPFSSRKYLDTLCEGDNPVLQRQKVGRAFIYIKQS